MCQELLEVEKKLDWTMMMKAGIGAKPFTLAKITADGLGLP